MPAGRKRLRSSRLADDFAEDESMDTTDVDDDDEELFELVCTGKWEVVCVH